MFGFFTLLNLAGIIAFVVFLIKVIKGRKTGQDISKNKKMLLISLSVWIVSFVLMVVTVPGRQYLRKKSAGLLL